MGDIKPRLLILVHTEEQFDWSQNFSRENTSISHINALQSFHEIFTDRDFKVTYLCTYPVVEKGKKVLQPLIADGKGEIGAHLHPWVSPPFIEEVSSFNSYPGNLSEEIERKKIVELTEKITENFGKAPKTYLAGRYGFGENTAKILTDLDYEVDCSPAPGWDFRRDGGPNYQKMSCHSFWDGPDKSLLRIPHSGGFVGTCCRAGKSLINIKNSPFSRSDHMTGIASRLGLASRVRITPENSSPKLMRQLAHDLYVDGVRFFTLSFHSPSLEPGHTPYVRNEKDLQKFKLTLFDFLDYFTNALGGSGVTASEAYKLAKTCLPSAYD